jgi:uncharacterized surface protein with fasciclin (FAS1) repeats
MMMPMMCLLSCVGLVFVVPSTMMMTTGFVNVASPNRSARLGRGGIIRMMSSVEQPLENQNLLAVRAFLQENYPYFYTILNLNDDVWKAIGEDDVEKGEVGYTIFAPNNDAFTKLGETKQSQLLDPRNLETTQKIAGYHVISEVVTAEQLYNSGGVITISGDIPIERSVTGGFFGIGGQEDGNILINKARAVQTWTVGTGLIHEVDDLVSPSILWRYMDQLRIPGSS